MNLRNPFFDPTGNVTEPMAKLLALFDFHRRDVDAVHRFTQDAWYVEGKLRVDIAERFPALKAESLPLMHELGLMQAVHASKLQYVTALIFGATVNAMRKRIKFLVGEWERGVRFLHIVGLASDRPLKADGIESYEAIADDSLLPFDNKVVALATKPQTEGDAMNMLLEHCTMQLPWMMRPRIVTYYGEGKGNTEDTLLQYVSAGMEPGSHLCVSSQPYVLDQQAAAQMKLPRPVEGIGYDAPTSTTVAQYLDTIAKTIHKIVRHRA